MESQEIRAHVISPKKGEKHGKNGVPSWDVCFTEVALIIAEDAMYPEIMPDENFEISGKSGFPSWNVLLINLARAIADYSMYPEEMPDEDFEVF